MKLWIYKHYKWDLYEVIWIAKNSDDLIEYVVYKALYNSKDFWNEALWIRKKEIFLQEVEIEWKKVLRFKYVWHENYRNI